MIAIQYKIPYIFINGFTILKFTHHLKFAVFFKNKLIETLKDSLSKPISKDDRFFISCFGEGGRINPKSSYKNLLAEVKDYLEFVKDEKEILEGLTLKDKFKYAESAIEQDKIFTQRFNGIKSQFVKKQVAQVAKKTAIGAAIGLGVTASGLLAKNKFFPEKGVEQQAVEYPKSLKNA